MKKKKYQHIKQSERLEIAWLKNKGHSRREIARILGRSPEAISREIKENSANGAYDPRKAQHKAYVKRKYSKYQGMKVVENSKLRKYIEKKLKENWSPEQIAGRLKNIEKNIKYASRGAIYKFIFSPYGRRLERCLRYKSRRKSRKYLKVCQLKNRSFIEERPEFTNRRERFGDWEGDFIVSGKRGKESLLVLVERKARYGIFEKIISKSPELVNQKLREMTAGISEFKSLTLDNDICFRKHERLSAALAAPIYFCHPYRAWEKGGVENLNKLIRQYLPKSCNIGRYSGKTIRKIQENLNNRPRKCLNYKTPLEAMLENNQFLKLKNLAMPEVENYAPSVLLEG